jgi:hypothetical protein
MHDGLANEFFSGFIVVISHNIIYHTVNMLRNWFSKAVHDVQ